MVYSLDSQRSSQLLALVLLTGALCGTSWAASLGFHCVFGDMLTTTTPDGETVQFCPTQMQPPFMNRGDYLVAVSNGTCYECMCAPDTGLACCECQRPRRGR
ncbi:hypothetical protein BsWGS_23087 [Bradybaena similaris]